MSAAEHFQKHAPKYAAGAVGVAMLTAAFTAPFEGYAPVAKHERGDREGVITYGYGTTNYDIPGLKVGDRISKDDARRLLETRLASKYLPPLRRCVPGFDALPMNQQVPLLDASYNLGDAAVCKSSIVRLLKVGDVIGAANAFMLYDAVRYPDGHREVLPGLVKRRRAECKMFSDDAAECKPVGVDR